MLRRSSCSRIHAPLISSHCGRRAPARRCPETLHHPNRDFDMSKTIASRRFRRAPLMIVLSVVGTIACAETMSVGLDDRALPDAGTMTPFTPPPEEAGIDGGDSRAAISPDVHRDRVPRAVRDVRIRRGSLPGEPVERREQLRCVREHVPGGDLLADARPAGRRAPSRSGLCGRHVHGRLQQR